MRRMNLPQTDRERQPVRSVARNKKLSALLVSANGNKHALEKSVTAPPLLRRPRRSATPPLRRTPHVARLVPVLLSGLVLLPRRHQRRRPMMRKM